MTRAVLCQPQAGRAPDRSLHRPPGFAAYANFRQILAVIPAIAVGMLLLRQMIVAGQIPVSSDILTYFYQSGLFAKRAYESGALPFWNPYQLSGEPFLADPASALFYAPNFVLYRLLDVATAIRMFILLHLSLAEVGMVLYLRRCRLSWPAVAFGSLAYTFSGYVYFRVSALPLLAFSSLIPWLFAVTEYAIRTTSETRRIGFSIGLAIVVGQQILVGFPQGVYYSLGFVGAYVLVLALPNSRQTGPVAMRVAARNILVAFALPVAVAIGLSAVQLLPSKEFLQLSDLAGGDIQGIYAGGWDGNDLPALFGSLGTSEVTSLYTGALAPALAIMAITLRPNRRTLFFGASIVLAGIVSTKVQHGQSFLLLIPGWNFLAAHMRDRILVVVVFSLAVLGAWAVDRPKRLMPWVLIPSAIVSAILLVVLVGNPASAAPPGLQHSAAVLTFGFLGLSLGWLILYSSKLLARAPERIAATGLVVLLAADLYSHDALLNVQFGPADQITASSAAVDVLRRDAEPLFRFFGTRPTMPHMGYGSANTATTFLTANAATTFNFYDSQGYNPIQLQRYREFIARTDSVASDYHLGLVEDFFSPYLKYLNVRYVVTDASQPDTASAPLTTPGLVDSAHPAVLDSAHPAVEVPVITRAGAVTTLTMESQLANASQVAQATPIGELDVHASDGSVTTLPIRAGVDTAEWAYDRQDVLAQIKHNRPEIDQSWPVTADFQGHSYLARLNLPRATSIAGITLRLLDPELSWSVEGVAGQLSIGDYYDPVYQDATVRVLQLKESLPRAFLVHGVDQLDDGSQILDRLISPTFDPRRRVVLEEPPDAASANLGAPLIVDGQWGGQALTDGVAVSDDQVRWNAYDAGSMSLQVHTRQPAVLVLSETYYPAWHANIDDIPAHLYRANYTFRAVAVPAGDHTVQLRYESGAFSLGIVISATVCAVVLTLLAAIALRGKLYTTRS